MTVTQTKWAEREEEDDINRFLQNTGWLRNKVFAVKTAYMPAVTVRSLRDTATQYVVCSCHVPMRGVEVQMGWPG